MSINIGGAIIPLISAFAAHWWGWQSAMLTPGIISMALGIWLTLQLKGTPQEEDCRPVGAWRQDPLELRQEQQSPPMGLWQMLRTTMLQNSMIWLLGVSYVLVYRSALRSTTGGNIWLTESHGVNLLSANATVMLFEAGGLLGALFAGWGLGSAVQRPAGADDFAIHAGTDGLPSPPSGWPGASLRAAGGLFLYGGLLRFGPQMLIGLAAVECGHKAAAGSITGFLGLFAYLGAALAGWPRRWSLNATAGRACSVAFGRRGTDGFITDAAADGEGMTTSAAQRIK